MSPNCDVTVIFPVHGQFGAFQKSDSGYIVNILYIFINKIFLSYKNGKQNYKISNRALTLLLWVKILLLPKNADFLQKNAVISKIKRASVNIFSETTYVRVLTYQMSSFYHNCNEFYAGAVILSPPPFTSKRTPKKPIQIKVNNRWLVLSLLVQRRA